MKKSKKVNVGDVRIGAFQDWPKLDGGVVLEKCPNQEPILTENRPEGKTLCKRRNPKCLGFNSKHRG